MHAVLQVYKGQLGYRPVAVKVVNSVNQESQRDFVREIALLRACHDPNIVMFLGASIQQGQTLLVMQYMANGNLWKALLDGAGGFSPSDFSWYRK